MSIKLTATMQEREHTRQELVKIDKVRRYLLEEGIIEMCIRDRSNTVMPVMRRIVNVSTNRSVTTVPNDLANETLSYFANTPQRLTMLTNGLK